MNTLETLTLCHKGEDTDFFLQYPETNYVGKTIIRKDGFPTKILYQKENLLVGGFSVRIWNKDPYPYSLRLPYLDHCPGKYNLKGEEFDFEFEEEVSSEILEVLKGQGLLKDFLKRRSLEGRLESYLRRLYLSDFYWVIDSSHNKIFESKSLFDVIVFCKETSYKYICFEEEGTVKSFTIPTSKWNVEFIDKVVCWFLSLTDDQILEELDTSFPLIKIDGSEHTYGSILLNMFQVKKELLRHILSFEEMFQMFTFKHFELKPGLVKVPVNTLSDTIRRIKESNSKTFNFV